MKAMKVFRGWLKKRVRNMLGLPAVEQQVDQIARCAAHLVADHVPRAERAFAAHEQQLGEIVARLREACPPTTKHRLLIDYPPSRNLRPRWGHSRPAHPGLSKLFAANKASYTEVLRKVHAHCSWFERIPFAFTPGIPDGAGWVGGPINAIDLAFLYTFVASEKPRTYLEIGSGVTTLFAARAKRDHNLATRIVSIDPCPRTEVDAVCDEVLRFGLEQYDLAAFASLQPGDIIFMDGSHRSFMNSDVTVFMLDVLPYLTPGVIVHFHDVVLPFDYPDMFVDWYWSEQYILGAYLLAAGPKIDVLMPGAYVSANEDVRAAVAPVLANWQGTIETWLSSGSIWFTHRERIAPA
jgi:hypothetical protein